VSLEIDNKLYLKEGAQRTLSREIVEVRGAKPGDVTRTPTPFGIPIVGCGEE